MKEYLRHEKISSAKGLAYTLGLVLGLAAISFVGQFISYLLHFPYFLYILYVFIIVGVTLLIKRRLQDYCYEVAEGRLIVRRLTGNNDKELLHLELHRVAWAGPYAGRPDPKLRLTRLTFQKKAESMVVCYFEKEKLKGVSLSVTPAFIDYLNERAQIAREKHSKRDQGKDERDGKDGEADRP